MLAGVDSDGTNNNERAVTMLTITIETDNDAFHHREWGELADILRKVAERAHRDDNGKVMDSNGNTVGAWTWTVGEA